MLHGSSKEAYPHMLPKAPKQRSRKLLSTLISSELLLPTMILGQVMCTGKIYLLMLKKLVQKDTLQVQYLKYRQNAVQNTFSQPNNAGKT
jgi:hypothetical protein